MQAVFDHLGIAGAELARRQRVEQRGVGQHQRRLVEGADRFLPWRRVDAGLAADGGIDLRQQGGRHLHEVDAAPDDGRGEAGEIADHAAAERDHESPRSMLRREHAVADLLEPVVSSSTPRPAARRSSRCACRRHRGWRRSAGPWMRVDIRRR